MDSLIKQIALTFESDNKTEINEALCRALKEILFSGMSRCGFFKECRVVPDMDHFSKNEGHIFFLRSDSEINWAVNLPYIRDELTAYGVVYEIKEDVDGFIIESTIPEEDVKIRLIIYIFTGGEGEKGINYSYVQSPMAYELRSLDHLPETLRNEIRTAFESWISSQDAPAENKKGSKKTRKSAKHNDEPKDQWVQPSLFDI